MLRFLGKSIAGADTLRECNYAARAFALRDGGQCFAPRSQPLRYAEEEDKKTQGDSRLPAFERHVFVCHNTRPADAPRPSCTSDGKSELHARLQQLSRDAGLGSRVRINKSGCLDQCEHGPTVVVYPDAVWYGGVRPEDAEEIVAEHLVAGRPVERLRIADACLNTKSCPHRQ
jgi:(2Fe-2S) ferredoxin